MRRRMPPERPATIVLDATAPTPLYLQLYEGLKQAVLAGQLKAGARVPSTRALAAELNVSRATVQLAFEQLMAEGYLHGQSGSGTYVAPSHPPEGVAHASVLTSSKRDT